jgi:hypothetical protein
MRIPNFVVLADRLSLIKVPTLVVLANAGTLDPITVDNKGLSAQIHPFSIAPVSIDFRNNLFFLLRYKIETIKAMWHSLNTIATNKKILVRTTKKASKFYLLAFKS